MPTAVVEKFDESDLIPEDVLFTGALITCVPVERSWDDRTTGQRVNRTKWTWTFKITEGQYQGRTVRGETFASLGEGSKPYEWIKALNGGVDPAIGAEINTDHYLGTACQFEVSHRAYKNREGQDRTAVEVSRVYPLTVASTY